MLIDTHCHLDDPSLASRLPSVLDAARCAGIGGFVVPGVAPSGWEKISAVADQASGIFPAFGLHPMHAGIFREEMLEPLGTHARTGIAIGEIGLDYLLAQVPREKQLHSFRCQLELAVSMGLPVLIHCRKAFKDLLLIMREVGAQRVGGIMHAFSGSYETARECLDMGFVISVSGPVTYLNAVKPVDLVKKVPLEYLVLETDAPDMTPVPYRGQDNEPAFMVETARKIAEIKEVSIDRVAEATSLNALRILHI